MNPDWLATKIIATGHGALQEYRCRSCKEECHKVLPLNDDPPKECIYENLPAVPQERKL